MKKNRFAGFIRISTLLCALSLPALLEAAAPDSTGAAAKTQPPLWTQAVKIFEANKDLVPGKVLQKVQELDDDGRVKSESRAEISIALDGGGKIKTDLVSASKDGKDVTAEERKKTEERAKKDAAEEKKKQDAARNTKKEAAKDSKDDSDEGSKERSHSFSSGDSPFNPELQSTVLITETNSRETIDGRLCVRFGYSYPAPSEKPSKKKPTVVKGSAWIDEGTGQPVKVEFTQDPLPRGAKSMLTTLHYGSTGNDQWILERMEFEARGAFLFFKKRIRGDLAFSDYWNYVEPSSEK